MHIPHLLSHFITIHVITIVDIRINSCIVWQSIQKQYATIVNHTLQ